ncbi:UV radiation resistance-associated protein-like [Macrosteles quadrilineatus]|uniref:UV radiation resistance-associated protein-like n=1 Tax=Macrosteles quadrilineatus TaxID=74068 RepID=UPI0023E3211D|nr:UV radiation resistance-associated protein-like [Macrosteles quadrilineatus]
MSIVPPRATLRWKEWLPLLTQQQRLRNLIQIIGFNVNPFEKCTHLVRGVGKLSYYYTLHLTTMSAPFYTSEKLESDNPKWADIEISQAIGPATGVVIRLWCHSATGEESTELVVAVWGIYFSGLAYIGPRLVTSDPSQFHSNTLILHMQGGYFTAPHCFKEPRVEPRRVVSVLMTPVELRQSYSVSRLLRLHSLQQAIKQHSVAAASLRERISDGSLSGSSSEGKESAMLRRVLHRAKPTGATPRLHQQLTAVKREVEEVRFRVHLLTHERDKKKSALRRQLEDKSKLTDRMLDEDLELVEKNRMLHKEMERLKDLKRVSIDAKENLFSVNQMLLALRRKRISELNYIYPISQIGDDKFAICGVHLPNSEDFAGHDEIMISVALGFVAHLVQMIAYFLHVPLRYSIVHAGSRSKIIDHITDKIPDKEREFPLFSKGKDKLQFNYGVYLLNKNIAQLRWYCSLTTSDLRCTLPNLLALLNLKPSLSGAGLEAGKRTMSSSTLELQGVRGLRPPQAPLCYSLDKGLDRLDHGSPRLVPRQRSITHNSSEPNEILVPHSSEDDGQREFLNSWMAQGPAPICSDSERSLRSSNDILLQEESLASIINKINSPSKYPTNISRDSTDAFTYQSIRQVTSQSTYADS